MISHEIRCASHGPPRRTSFPHVLAHPSRAAASRCNSCAQTKTDTVYTYERQYGSFTRSFTLPDGADVDHAKSELKGGVLTLVIPKKPGAQSKKISISAGGSKS